MSATCVVGGFMGPEAEGLALPGMIRGPDGFLAARRRRLSHSRQIVSRRDRPAVLTTGPRVSFRIRGGRPMKNLAAGGGVRAEGSTGSTGQVSGQRSRRLWRAGHGPGCFPKRCHSACAKPVGGRRHPPLYRCGNGVFRTTLSNTVVTSLGWLLFRFKVTEMSTVGSSVPPATLQALDSHTRG